MKPALARADVVVKRAASRWNAIAEVLARYCVDLSEADLAALIAEVFEAPSGPGATTMTAADTQWSAEHSGVATPVADTPRQLDRLRVEVEVVASSVPAATLAARWGVDPSRVRHRASEGRLYSFRAGRALRFPQWRFDAEGNPLPGLTRVLAALPANLHPAEVEGFFVTPNPNLVLGDEPVSGADWLVSGGDQEVVADLAGDLDRWYAPSPSTGGDWLGQPGTPPTAGRTHPPPTPASPRWSGRTGRPGHGR